MISMIYGGVLAWHQRDLKKMVAYSSMSHMGVVVLGIATLNEAGLNGAVMQMVAHGLVAGSLFLLIGLLYERTHTRDIADYSSLVQVMPRFAFFTVLALVAAVGFPGTAGFIAEIHVLTGGFARWSGWIIILSLSVLISAAYAFRTVGHLFTGPVREEMRRIPDLSRAELAAVSVLASGILLLGIFPAAALGLISSSVGQLSKVFG
jgi:NADH-quinone oxidoreductase subunit M